VLKEKAFQLASSGQRRFFEASALILSVLSLVAAFLVSYYLRRHPLIENWLYLFNDGWCPQKEETTAQAERHCFGDFGMFHFLLEETNPWENSINLTFPNPPTSVLLNSIFLGVGDFAGGYWAALVVFFLFAGVLFFVAIVVAFRDDYHSRLVSGVLLGLSFPTIIAFDRGNQVLLLIPLMVLAAHFYFRGNLKSFLPLVLLMSLLKPHFLIFSLLALPERTWRTITVWVAFVMAQIGSLLILSKPVFSSALAWIKNMVAFSDYQPLSADFPQNISISRGLFIAVFGHFLSDGSQDYDSSAVATLSWMTFLFVLALILFTVSTLIWLNLSDSDRKVLFLGMTTLIALWPSTTYGYYGFVFVLTLIFLSRAQLVLPARSFGAKRLGVSGLLLAGLLGSIRLPIHADGHIWFSTSDLAAPVFLVGFLVFLGSLWSESFRVVSPQVRLNTWPPKLTRKAR
jgi:hypothetical protein